MRLARQIGLQPAALSSMNETGPGNDNVVKKRTLKS